MRFLVIALCIAVASATYYNKFRFNKMLNCYNNGLCSKNFLRDPELLFGSENVDDYLEDYIDQIRGERMINRYQCPLDTDKILSDWETPLMGGLEDVYGVKGIYDSEWELPTESIGLGLGLGQFGLPIERLTELGIPVERLIQSGLPLERLIQSGLPLERLIQSGLPLERLIQSGLPLEHLIQSGLPIERLTELGIPVERIRELGLGYNKFGLGLNEWDLSSPLTDIESLSTETGLGLRLHPWLKEVEHANCKLASNLYKQCTDERDDKNVVVSPISIQLALATLNAGARGNTKRQISRVIAGSLQKHERRLIYKLLTLKLKGLTLNEFSPLMKRSLSMSPLMESSSMYSPMMDTSSWISLLETSSWINPLETSSWISPFSRKSLINPVTGIFLSHTTPAQQFFIQLVKGNLGATVKHCNFHRMPQQCRQIVNQWLSTKTLGKMNQILPVDAITDNTKMILVNGMHVQATWGPQMIKHITKVAKFYPLNTRKVKTVEVLETKGRFKYFEDELVKIVGLPTEQEELTLYVVVPKEKDGLNEVEKLHLQDGVQLKQLLDRTDKHIRLVGVQLPKFQIKHKVDVRRTLRKQGVVDAFDPLRADFSGITGVPKSQIDDLELEQLSPIRRDSMYGSLYDDSLLGSSGIYGTEQKLHLNKFIHQSTIKVTETGITATTGSGSYFDDVLDSEYSTLYGRSIRRNPFLLNDDISMLDDLSILPRGPFTSQKMIKANRAFAFVLKHNPTNQLVFVGRVIDAAQKKPFNIQPTLDLVDQF